jgi:NAD(P)-dependent dehydrogenase (short-subunit alcohol dehydrogenase family)
MGQALVGKVAIVTGGGQGIGEAISIRFAQEGAKVVVSDINPKTAKKVALGIQGRDGEALAIQSDVSKSEDVRRLVKETLTRFGEIDILVNNAGVHKRTPFLDIPEKDWDWMLDINLKGSFLCSKMVAREMVKAKKRGKIVNIASIAAEAAIASQVHYSASKAGVYMLTKGMALELAPYGINVNSVGPGPIQTAILRYRLEDPKQLKLLIRNIPLGRVGQPADIADAVFFLAGPESDFITGHMLVVDGGWLIK